MTILQVSFVIIVNGELEKANSCFTEPSQSDRRDYGTIIIFSTGEVRIEKSIMRVTVRHHKACPVMQNSYTQ